MLVRGTEPRHSIRLITRIILLLESSTRRSYFNIRTYSIIVFIKTNSPCTNSHKQTKPRFTARVLPCCSPSAPLCPTEYEFVSLVRREIILFYLSDEQLPHSPWIIVACPRLLAWPWTSPFYLLNRVLWLINRASSLDSLSQWELSVRVCDGERHNFVTMNEMSRATTLIQVCRDETVKLCNQAVTA